MATYFRCLDDIFGTLVLEAYYKSFLGIVTHIMLVTKVVKSVTQISKYFSIDFVFNYNHEH